MNEKDIIKCLDSMDNTDTKDALKKTTEDAIEYGVH